MKKVLTNPTLHVTHISVDDIIATSSNNATLYMSGEAEDNTYSDAPVRQNIWD